MHKQEMEKVQTRNDVTVLERLSHCPECKEKNILSSVERLQYEEDRYWVFCTRRDGCSFLEEFRGKAVIAKEDLIMHGLPGQLIQHMDIFYEDINKIVRLCMSEYIKVNYLASLTTGYDLEAVKDSVRILAESHGLGGLSPPTEAAKTSESQTTANEVNLIQPGKSDLRAERDSVGTIVAPSSLEFLSQHSQSTKPYESDLSAEEEMLKALAGFTDLDGLSQTSQKNQRNELQTMSDEDLVQLFQILDSEPLQPAKIKDGESTLLEDQENAPTTNEISCKSKKLNKCLQSSKFYNPYDSMKKLADSLVADLPIFYQEEIKAAFSKIEGYNFPQDFANDATPDKLPLFKILEERERQERIKAEVDEQLKDFMSEMDGFDLLLS